MICLRRTTLWHSDAGSGRRPPPTTKWAFSFDHFVGSGEKHRRHGEVAVGTRIAPRPPHRSRRALLTHRVLPRVERRHQMVSIHLRSGAQPPNGSTWLLGSRPNHGRLSDWSPWVSPSLHDLRWKVPSIVRSFPQYYGLIRLLIHVHTRRVA